MKRIIALIVTGLLVLVLLTGLSAVPASARGTDDWSVGDARIAEEVTSLVIESPDIDVFLKTGSGQEILITESSGAELSDDQKVRWQLDGTTLRIKYGDSIIQGIFGFLLGNNNRSLTVTLPEDLVLDSLEVSVASADVTTDLLHSANADLSAASGDMNVLLAGDMENAAFSSASGNITASLETAEAVRADASSGDLFVTLQTAGQFAAGTSSGEITLKAGEITDLSIKSASGEVYAALAKAPEEASISTASGDVTAALPEDADLTITVTTASGDFTSQLPVVMDGKTYALGNGSGQMSISTASGDISIRKAD